MVRDTIEAATDDMSRAVSFVRARSVAYNIDIARIAIGGFSAGAIIALNAAFGEHAPVAAVVALSGRLTGRHVSKRIGPPAGAPAVLMSYGEHDLPAILNNVPAMRQNLVDAGIPFEIVQVPGQDHFNLKTATVKRDDGTITDVETCIAEFLSSHLASKLG